MRSAKKTLVVLALAGAAAVVLTPAAPLTTQAEGKQMMKAMWVVRWSITSPERITRIVELAKSHGYGALFVQVRGRGDAFYKSRFEPRALELAGQPEDFDPLQALLTEARKAGIQVHAWLNTHYTWGIAQLPDSPEHIVNKHPDWLMRDRQGNVTMTATDQVEGAYTCPSNPEVRDHVANCFLDVATNYSVDGIHFDFVRYPSRDYCYCDGCLSRFRDYLSTRVRTEDLLTISNLEDRTALTLAYSKEWDDWRRRQVTELVSRIRARIKTVRPKMVVSAAVFPDPEDARNYRFQDWRQWMSRGCLDMLCPMAYSTSTDTVAAQLRCALDDPNGRPVWAGIGAWRLTPEETADKVKAAERLGAKGFILFSYGGVTDEGASEAFLDRLDQLLAQP